jgi:hypothetical protein
MAASFDFWRFDSTAALAGDVRVVVGHGVEAV